jgi:predicted rRNA methylase YqxC with S4 and FtsJ domains
VDDAKLLREILMEIFLQLSREGVGVTDIIESPILGRKGNREFLALLDAEHGCREEEFVLKVGRFS